MTWRDTLPSSSGAETRAPEEVDDKLVLPPTMATDEERSLDDDAFDYFFLEDM